MSVLSRTVVVLVVLQLAGCSNDSSSSDTTGSGGSTASATGGRTSTSGDASVAGSKSYTYGDVLEFVPASGTVPYAIGPNSYGIHGSGFLAKSVNGNTITVGSEPGKICIQGNLEEVPGGNYGQYWGVEIGFNLNQGAPVDGDASAAPDAADVARDWMTGSVIGFSFVIEGPTINLIRFKSLPSGYDATLESSVFCKGMTPKSGVPQDSLFTEMMQYCWNATANVQLPTAQGLANISWQMPADAGVGPRPFDWCLKDLRPILAN